MDLCEGVLKKEFQSFMKFWAEKIIEFQESIFTHATVPVS
jgi:hypothetical protein